MEIPGRPGYTGHLEHSVRSNRTARRPFRAAAQRLHTVVEAPSTAPGAAPAPSRPGLVDRIKGAARQAASASWAFACGVGGCYADGFRAFADGSVAWASIFTRRAGGESILSYRNRLAVPFDALTMLYAVTGAALLAVAPAAAVLPAICATSSRIIACRIRRGDHAAQGF